MTQNQPKQAKASRNDPKPAKMISQKLQTTQNLKKIGEIWDYLLAFIFQISSPNVQIWAFWTKKYLLSILKEISCVPCFECVNFKFVICFWKFQAQIPFNPFGPKCMNFLILMKFYMYPILKVLISNLTLVSKFLSPNPQIWAFWAKKYQLFHLNEILSVFNLEGADFKSDFRFQKFWNFITFLIRINYFVFSFYIFN